MGRYVALLRGINVGGKNQTSMPVLKSALEEAGLKDVVTYLQSGNVVFSSPSQPDALAKQLQLIIKKAFGHDVGVLVKSTAQISQVLKQNPFLAAPGIDTIRLHVTFLENVPKPELLLTISPDFGGEDKWAPIGDAVYLYCPGGYGRTKLSNGFFERKLKIAATTRNWKTVTALAELLAKA